jgi:predicted nucleic acid-binding protein
MIFADTDVIIDILRNHPDAITWLGENKDDELIISGFVAMELIQGCRDKRETQIIHKFIDKVTLIWPDVNSLNMALELFLSAKLKTGISLLDAVIGAQACTLSLPLYTFNIKDYKHISNLQTIQPYKR